MSDLIRRKDLCDFISAAYYDDSFSDPEVLLDEFFERAKHFSAVDAVEVVRCKDCEFCRGSFDPWTKTSVQVCGYVGYNPVQSSQVEDNDYCSHGERRKENATD